MTVIKGIWYALRGLGLLVVLSVLFVGVLAASCLAKLVLGSGAPDYAGRLHLGS